MGKRGLWQGMPVQVHDRCSSNLAAAAASSQKTSRQNEKDSSSDSAEAGNEEFNPLNATSNTLLVTPSQNPKQHELSCHSRIRYNYTFQKRLTSATQFPWHSFSVPIFGNPNPRLLPLPTTSTTIPQRTHSPSLLLVAARSIQFRCSSSTLYPHSLMFSNSP